MRFEHSYRKLAKPFANSGDSDQMLRPVASDLGLQCLPITLLRVSRLQWVNLWAATWKMGYYTIWVAPSENLSSGIYGQRRCPLIESLDITDFINGKQLPGWDFAHAWDESESVHFAHARRHNFAWRGPYEGLIQLVDFSPVLKRDKIFFDFLFSFLQTNPFIKRGLL